ncbi:hypothetical protein GCM10020256_53210 [Streptomyces thermocoprophilus]
MRVGEGFGVHAGAAADEVLDAVRDVPHVHVHPGEDAVLLHPERDELPLVGVAADHHLVVGAGRRPAAVLHAEVVLVGEEVRHPVVDDVLAEHGAGGGRAAVQRVRPVLHPHAGVEQGVRERRHVAGGVDVRVGGAQPLVDADAAAVRPVGDLQAGGLRERGARCGADRGEHVVRGVFLAVVGAGGEDHAVLADDLGEPRPEVEADAVLAVQFGEEVAQLGAEDAVQRGGRRFDHGDLGAVLAGRRRDLQADPAGTGDHDVAVVPAERGEHMLEAFGVGEAAQMVHARQVGARDVQAARLGAGRQEQFVVAHDGAVLAEADGLRGAVDGVDGLPEVQFDVVARVPGGLVDEDAVAFLLAEKVALGQGRTLVRVVALVADQYHAAGESLGTERLGRLRAGQAASDDDKSLIRVDHLMPPRKGAATWERPARSVRGKRVWPDQATQGHISFRGTAHVPFSFSPAPSDGREANAPTCR